MPPPSKKAKLIWSSSESPKVIDAPDTSKEEEPAPIIEAPAPIIDPPIEDPTGPAELLSIEEIGVDIAKSLCGIKRTFEDILYMLICDEEEAPQPSISEALSAPPYYNGLSGRNPTGARRSTSTQPPSPVSARSVLMARFLSRQGMGSYPGKSMNGGSVTKQ